MYKVFVNNKPIILSDKSVTNSIYEIYLFKEIRFDEILHKLKHTQTPGIYLYHTDLDLLWNEFKTFFKTVIAAGGLVKNTHKEILFIFRNDTWDLPKGKLEKGETLPETAIREVEEECGINQLTIEAELPTTYHIFYEDQINKLKITHWYLMHTKDVRKPVPQIEEGISIARFIPITRIDEMYIRMYANIKELIRNQIELI